MVTEDQLNRIKQLRANGRSHQEIADEVGMSRSAVAYQLKKLKDTPVPASTIQVIVAQGFEPQTTTVSFDPRIFEQHRQSDTLYATGQDLYEMRGEIIHKTTLPNGVQARDYPEIVDLIRADANWFSLPNGPHLIKEFKTKMNKRFELTWSPNTVLGWTAANENIWRSSRMKMVQKLDFNYNQIRGPIANYWQELLEKKAKTILKGMPNSNEPTKLLRYVANLPKSPEEIINDATNELNALLTSPKIERTHMGDGRWELKFIEHPPLVIEYFASKGIEGPNNIKFCIKYEIDNPAKMKEVKKSGARSREEFDKLKVVKFPDQASYERAQKWAIAIEPRHDRYQNVIGSRRAPPHLNSIEKRNWEEGIRRPNPNNSLTAGHISYIPLKEMEELEKIGWTPETFTAAKELSFRETDFELYSVAQEKLKSLNLPLNKANVQWAKSVKWELDSYAGFPSPRAAVIHGIIEMSPTTHLRLDSLLTQYQSNAAPGPDIHNVQQLHNLLCQKPFDKMCVSNLEGGIVEKNEKLIVVEKEIVKEVIVEKEVVVEKKVDPLFDYSAYSELNSGNSKMNRKIRDAIDRRSLDDSLTAAFTRFESHAKKLWKKTQSEAIPVDRSGVRMVNMSAAELNFTPAMVDKLHQARMLRNDVMHPDDPSGLKLTQTHVKRVLEATEKIIVALG